MARSQKEEALEDVLGESESEEEGSTPASRSALQSTEDPVTLSEPNDGGNIHRTAGADAAVSDSTEACVETAKETACLPEEASRAEPGRDRCFVSTLPPDLLLQCAEFLGDCSSLCRVREVSLRWLGTLDGLEAGRRLWRPVFYRLRASGAIHAATDCRGQRRRHLKVYDLGSSGSSQGIGTRVGTPAPGVDSTPKGRQGTAGSTSTKLACGAQAELGSPAHAASSGADDSGSAGGTPCRSRACSVCGLIQRQGYMGRDCEMCASPLLIVSSRGSHPGTPRLPYKRVNLSESSVEDSKAERSGSASSPSAGGSCATKLARTPGSDEKMAGAASTFDSAGNGEKSEWEDGGDAEGDVDWHLVVKRLAEEKRISAGWGTLHHGWVWLQRALQVRRRKKRSLESHMDRTHHASHRGPLVPTSLAWQGICEGLILSRLGRWGREARTARAYGLGRWRVLEVHEGDPPASRCARSLLPLRLVEMRSEVLRAALIIR